MGHAHTTSPEPACVHAAQAVVGKKNAADQETVQLASNSIDNENVAGRRLLGGEYKGSRQAPLVLVSAWLHLSVAAPEQGMMACCCYYDQGVSA